MVNHIGSPVASGFPSLVVGWGEQQGSKRSKRPRSFNGYSGAGELRRGSEDIEIDHIVVSFVY
jgi:hypothetical protein